MNAFVPIVGLVALAGAIILSPPMNAQRPEPRAGHGPPNFQSNPEYARIDRDRGAVLCAWMIVTEVKAIHQQCHAGDPPEIAAALNRSLERFNGFIVANSDETREALEASVARRLSEARAETGLCTGDGEQFYRHVIRDAPPESTPGPSTPWASRGSRPEPLPVTDVAHGFSLRNRRTAECRQVHLVQCVD